jgi:TrmH RNA methyltransferase
MKPEEFKLCGLAAVRARFDRDPASIIRLYFDAPMARRIGALCRALAEARKVYRCVEPAELAKVAGSLHHGGIVAVVAAPAMRRAGPAEAAQWAQRGESLVVLDRIGNAHNLGAIARTAAFFNVPRLVLADDAAAARPGEAAYRVAEGGLEFLEVWTVGDIAAFLRALAAAGFEVIGAATRGGAPGVPRAAAAEDGARPRRGKSPAPWALVLGNEEHGLAPAAAAACTRRVTIAGGGRVESLNVSVAAAILLSRLVEAAPRPTPMGTVARHGS